MKKLAWKNLGGARVHSEITGNAHFYAESEEQCFDQIKELVTYIPWNNEKTAITYPQKTTQDKTIQY